MRKSIAAVCLVIALLFVLPLAAQVTTADINGRVLDPKGLAVAGARVTVTSTETGLKREAITVDTGEYAVTLLPVGTYKVTVEKEGFAKSVVEKLELTVGAKQTLDITLKVGAVTEVVSVTEEPPLIEATRSDLSGSVSPAEVKQLPVLDRNFAGLMSLVPGVRPAPGFDPTKTRSGNASLNGSDGRAFDYNVDGADNKDNVIGGLVQNFTMEGIQEFNVVINRYTAESGRSAAGVVNVISKSGTNTLHGSLFGLFQVSTLNKIDFFTEQQGLPKPNYHRYHFGGSAGGPLIKDKLFVFGAYEHKREPGKITVEPSAFRELSLFPLASPVSSLSTPYLDHLLTVKLDYRVSDRQGMFFRYARERWTNPNDQLGNPFVADLSQTNSNLNQFHDFAIGHTFVISPTKTNSINVHFQDFVNAILADPQRTFTVPVAGGGSTTNPEIIFPSGAEIGQNVNVPQQTLIRKYQLRDDFSLVHGRHNIKFGGNEVYLAKLGGFFFFGAAGYQVTFWDDPSVITTNTALYPNKFATPGAVQEITFATGSGRTDNQKRPHALAFYFQDDFKVTPHLTLNLGVRWDANINFLPAQLRDTPTTSNRTINILRQIIAANPSSAAAADGLNRAKLIAGNVDDLTKTTADWKEFQPRVGFAWDPIGSGKMVIRGGYGIARDQVFQNLTLFSLQQANETLYQQAIDLVDTGRPGACTGQSLCTFRFGTDPLPTSAFSPSGIAAGAFGRINDPRMTDPWSQQASIGASWQFHPDYAFSVDYYHVLGTHEPRVLNINPKLGSICTSGFPTSNTSDPRCVRGASTRFFDAAFAAAGLGAGRLEQTNMIGTNNRSRFDSVNFVLRKRLSHNYSFQASYVLSRSESWGARATSSYSGNAVAITPELQFLSGEFGPTGFDERHRLVLSGIFQLPYGFEIGPIFQASSARPFPLRTGADNDGDGRKNLDRACVGSTISSPIITNGCQELPINTLRGDPFVQMDVRFAKAFKFRRERMALRLYWEMYDLFNRQNFGNNLQDKATASNFLKPLGYAGGPGPSDSAARGFGAGVSGPFRSQFGFRFEF
jgi:Carboxypeptidase regulatory-like domain/TonB dependent receptor